MWPRMLQPSAWIACMVPFNLKRGRACATTARRVTLWAFWRVRFVVLVIWVRLRMQPPSRPAINARLERCSRAQRRARVTIACLVCSTHSSVSRCARLAILVSFRLPMRVWCAQIAPLVAFKARTERRIAMCALLGTTCQRREKTSAFHVDKELSAM